MTARVVFRRLPGLMHCEGFDLARFHAFGYVWLLASDLNRLPAFSTWALRQSDPSITGRRLRLDVGNMHPRLGFRLADVRRMALQANGPAAKALFLLVTAEIEAGCDLFPGGAHGCPRLD